MRILEKFQYPLHVHVQSCIYTVENFLLVQNFTELLVNPFAPQLHHPFKNFVVLIFIVFSLSAKNAKFCTYTYVHDTVQSSLTSGRVVGLKLAKSESSTQSQPVSRTFSVLMSP